MKVFFCYFHCSYRKHLPSHLFRISFLVILLSLPSKERKKSHSIVYLRIEGWRIDVGRGQENLKMQWSLIIKHRPILILLLQLLLLGTIITRLDYVCPFHFVWLEGHFIIRNFMTKMRWFRFEGSNGLVFGKSEYVGGEPLH